MPDTPFTTFAFKATGAPTNRTMPERLAEEKNVLDFGADPNPAGADSTDEIQAAVDAARADGSGVFFPTGTYTVSDSGSGSAILLNDDEDFGFYMRGTGASSITSSDCPGYLIDRSLVSPNNTFGPRVFEGLAFNNSDLASINNGGCLRIGSSIGVVVRNCRFGAVGTGLTTEDSPGNSSTNIVLDTSTFTGGDNDSIGFVMGGSGSMTCCDFNGIGRATIVYGKGISMNGNRCERCEYAFQLGVDAEGTDRGLSGFSLACEEMEGVVNFVDFMGTVTGFSLCGVGCLGHESANAGIAGYNHVSDYGIRIRPNTAYYGEISACGGSQTFDIGCLYMEDYAATGLGKRSYVTFTNSDFRVGAGAGVPWRIPTDSAWPSFLQCGNMHSGFDAPYGTRYLYANLPAGGNLQEGDEFDISNGSTSTIGATATGGGVNRIKIRWNGSAWICLPG